MESRPEFRVVQVLHFMVNFFASYPKPVNIKSARRNHPSAGKLSQLIGIFKTSPNVFFKSNKLTLLHEPLLHAFGR